VSSALNELHEKSRIQKIKKAGEPDPDYLMHDQRSFIMYFSSSILNCRELPERQHIRKSGQNRKERHDTGMFPNSPIAIVHTGRMNAM